MALQLGALYAALLAGNVPDDKARAAAEEAAGYESRLAAIDTRLTPLTWMVGVNCAMALAILLRVFFH